MTAYVEHKSYHVPLGAVGGEVVEPLKCNPTTTMSAHQQLRSLRSCWAGLREPKGQVTFVPGQQKATGQGDKLCLCFTLRLPAGQGTSPPSTLHCVLPRCPCVTAGQPGSTTGSFSVIRRGNSPAPSVEHWLSSLYL